MGKMPCNYQASTGAQRHRARARSLRALQLPQRLLSLKQVRLRDPLTRLAQLKEGRRLQVGVDTT
jgi:hypothetical protein